jgi:hypothetical protein
MFGNRYVGIEGCPVTEPRAAFNSGSVQSSHVDPTQAHPNIGMDPGAHESLFPSLRAIHPGEAGPVRRSVQGVIPVAVLLWLAVPSVFSV